MVRLGSWWTKELDKLQRRTRCCALPKPVVDLGFLAGCVDLAGSEQDQIHVVAQLRGLERTRIQPGKLLIAQLDQVMRFVSSTLSPEDRTLESACVGRTPSE